MVNEEYLIEIKHNLQQNSSTKVIWTINKLYGLYVNLG